ncbi:MAG: twin-arginine translocase subunit TatC [Bacteroidetes bacterium]|nr:twin-arginine translocase subunit TatC [Bacteroidota bacterium]
MAEQQNPEKPGKKDSFKEMTFWEHLGELRKRLIRIVLAVLAASILAFIERDIIFDTIILAPKDGDFITYRWLCKLGEWLHVDSLCMTDTHIKLINFNLSGQFMTHMTISMVAGLIIAMPYIFWQIWQFIKPALYEKERKYARTAVFIMSALFIIGVLFSYFFMVPWTLNFLGTYQVSSKVENQIALSSYISTVVNVILSVGATFELPVVIYVLARVGIISPEFLVKNRKYAFVIVLIIAAIITPPDVFSQIIVTIPLWALYEASILVARRVHPKVNDDEPVEAD